MIKKHSIRDFIPLLVFAVLFTASMILHHSWRGEFAVYFPTVYDMAAALYLLPINCVLGTTIVLYTAELLGIVRIGRKKAVRIILLVVVSLLMIWWMLLIASIHGKGEYQLLGASIQSFISALPEWVLPIQKSLFFHVHIDDVFGMIIYELMGAGLFGAIGKSGYSSK